MTVLEVLQKEANIAECVFFNRSGELLTFELCRNYDRLLYTFGDKEVLDYDKVPYSWVFHKLHVCITPLQRGSFVPLLYTLKITLDID